MGGAGDPDDIEVLLTLARSGPLGAQVLLALIRRIVEAQDSAEEAELLAMVAEVEALLRRRRSER
jgi:hypothetical protein